MVTQHTIKYKNRPPSTKVILQKLRQNTGLDIKLNETEDQFVHPDFLDKQFFFVLEKKEINVFTGISDYWYLLLATINAMVDLGGSYDSDIPKWAKMKWKDANIPKQEKVCLNTHNLVYFDGEPPTPEAVLTKLREITGLNIEFNKTKLGFLHLLIQDNFTFVIRHSEVLQLPPAVIITVGSTLTNTTKYFIGSILATLIDLGGKYNDTLPNYARERWEIAKEHYQ